MDVSSKEISRWLLSMEKIPIHFCIEEKGNTPIYSLGSLKLRIHLVMVISDWERSRAAKSLFIAPGNAGLTSMAISHVDSVY